MKRAGWAQILDRALYARWLEYRRRRTETQRSARRVVRAILKGDAS
jgi:hypothetical protein